MRGGFVLVFKVSAGVLLKSLLNDGHWEKGMGRYFGKKAQDLAYQGNVLIDGVSQRLGIDVRYFVNGGFWIGTGYVCIALLRLVQIIVLARLMDQELYGQYQFVLATITAVIVFSLPSMDGAITQSVARGYSSSLVSGTREKLKWSLLGSLVLLGVGVFFRVVMPLPIWHIFLLAAIFFPTYSGFTAVITFYYGKQEFAKGTFYDVLPEIASTGALIGGFLLTKSLAVMIGLMMVLVSGVYCGIYARAKHEIKETKPDKGLVSFGRNLTFSTVLSSISPYVDKFVIASVVGFEGLAVYAVAMSVTSYLSVSGTLLSTLLLPKLSRANARQAGKIKRFFWWVVLAVAAGVCVLVVVLPRVMRAVFSEKYGASIPYAQVALASLVFLIPSSILSSYFQSRRQRKVLYAHNLSSGVVNLVLLAVFVPLLGTFGAVLSKVLLGFWRLVFLGVSFHLWVRYPKVLLRKLNPK